VRTGILPATNAWYATERDDRCGQSADVRSHENHAKTRQRAEVTHARPTACESIEELPHKEEQAQASEVRGASAQTLRRQVKSQEDHKANKEGAQVTRWSSARLVCRLLGGTVATLALLLATPTVAETFASAVWRLDSNTAPSYLAAGSEARVIATASNLGNATVLGNGAHAMTLMDKLPAHLRVPTTVQASAIEGKLETNERSEVASFELVCTIEEAQRKEVSCETAASTQPLAPYTQLRITIPVEATAEAVTGELNTVSLSGGEPEAHGEQSRPITLENAPTPFGIERKTKMGP
jgi:hypothetical protein